MESKAKTRSTIVNTLASKGIIVPNEKPILKCQECGNDFVAKQKITQKYCSRKCGFDSRKTSEGYLRYYADCKFRFNVYKFPGEFDLGLINEHGWYKAANRGNNLDGVSRDHKISVKYGWENSIPADVISHPANCQLMRHTANKTKHTGCSITSRELELAISEWNQRHRG